MRGCYLPRVFAWSCASAALLAAGRLDLAPFARPCCAQEQHRAQTLFDYGHPRGLVRVAGGRYIYGLQWAEERDLFEVAVEFRRPYDSRAAVIQYWAHNWPPGAPRMPAIEDPVDDPWQGEWLTAAADVACQGRRCRFTFRPLKASENPRASNLPGLSYRRAVKFRLVFPAGERPDIGSVQVFSQSTVRPLTLRVSVRGKPSFRAYNGAIRRVETSGADTVLVLDAAAPAPAGSHDVTVIEVRSGGAAFAFEPAAVGPGGMYIPDCDAWIRLPAETVRRGAAVNQGARIRERLAREPEQTFERASREIPPLDPVERQGGRLYLPLAADASWQKFALEWGGNVTISKRGTKAFGRELERLAWPGDRISWMIGTGATPGYRLRSGDSVLATLEDHLPVAIARWSSGKVEYRQEAFATLLSGPLSPEDPGRSEQTPAVLMMKIRARNASAAPEDAHVWLRLEPDEALAYDHGLLTADRGRSVRAGLRLASGAVARLEGGALHWVQRLGPGEEASSFLALPFIPGLSSGQRQRLAALDHGVERDRVIAYWRAAIARGVPFRVPEERFNTFAKGLIVRIRISATKDPGSALYMVPAASYGYKVFANEAAFQAQLLDIAGHHRLAETYLEGLVRLQGSKPFRGSYTGDQKAVYHGARVDAEYDYTASQYNLDHGTVLWTLAEHYFITRHRDWLRRVTPGMKLAADWIVQQRALTKVLVDGVPCPEYGLLPAGNLEDNPDWGHWFSVNAYASLGMTAMAAALADIGDPESPRYRHEASLYRADLRRAVLAAAARAPVIRLRDNTWVPYVPTRAHQRIRLFGPIRTGYYSRYPGKVLPTYRLSATRELLYGPLILVDTGIFDAREPLAGWVVDDWEDNATMSEPLGLHVHGWVDEDYWFSRGGMVFQANLQNPVRTYLRRGEARAAIRNLYNDFVSCYYPSVNVFTEEYRQWRSPSGPFYKIPDEAKFVHRLRDLLVFEYRDDLHLAAATPARWLSGGNTIAVSAAPTHFGPVSYRLEAGPGEVRGLIELPARNSYRHAWLYIRLPEGRGISAVTIEGRRWTDWNAAESRIRLPKSGQPVRLVITTD